MYFLFYFPCEKLIFNYAETSIILLPQGADRTYLALAALSDQFQNFALGFPVFNAISLYYFDLALKMVL